MMTTPSSRETSSRADVDLPGTSSANAKFLCSSVWQKYWDRNNSGKQTICAPCLAASRMKSSAREKFSAGSVPDRIWMSAIFVIPRGVEESRREAFLVTSRDVSTSLDMTRDGV